MLIKMNPLGNMTEADPIHKRLWSTILPQKNGQLQYALKNVCRVYGESFPTSNDKHRLFVESVSGPDYTLSLEIKSGGLPSGTAV